MRRVSRGMKGSEEQNKYLIQMLNLILLNNFDTDLLIFLISEDLKIQRIKDSERLDKYNAKYLEWIH